MVAQVSTTNSKCERLKQETFESIAKSEQILKTVADEGRTFLYPSEAIALKAAGYDDAGRHYGDPIVIGRMMNVLRHMRDAGTKKQYEKAQQDLVDAKQREIAESETLIAAIGELEAKLEKLKRDREQAASVINRMKTARDHLRTREMLPKAIDDLQSRLRAVGEADEATNLLDFYVDQLG